MRKFLYFFIPLFVLGIFVLIMLSGSYFKIRATGTSDDFVEHVEIIKANIEQGQWDKADENTNKLKDSWKRVSKKIQFSEERDEMNQIDRTIARLKGAIHANDKTSAIIELFEAKLLWENVGK